MMEWRRGIQRIEVQIEGDEEPCVGTAFAVGERLAMTALHVIVPNYADQPTAPARWPEIEVGGRVARVVWPDREALPGVVDLAVVELENGSDAPFDFVFDCDPVWAARAPVDTKGYPAAMEGGGPLEILGWLQAEPTEDGLGRMRVDASIQVRDAAVWGGVSGSPVRVHDRVVGVIVHKQDAFLGHLDVVRFDQVFASEDAVGLLAILEDARGPGELDHRIRAALADERIRAVLGEFSGRMDPRDPVTPSTEELLGMLRSGEEWRDPLRRAFARAVSEDDERLAIGLTRLLQHLVAYHAPSARLDAQGVFRVAAFGASGLEIVAARVAGRAPDFALAEDHGERSQPPGRDVVPFGKETIDPGRDVLVQFKEHLTKALLPGEDDAVRAKLPNENLREMLRELRQRPERGNAYYVQFDAFARDRLGEKCANIAEDFGIQMFELVGADPAVGRWPKEHAFVLMVMHFLTTLRDRGWPLS